APSPHRGSRTVGPLSSAGVPVGGRPQGGGVLFPRVEGAGDPDDTLTGYAAPGEAVALGHEPVPDGLRQGDEDEVDLGRAPEPNAGDLGEALPNPMGHGIGVAGVPQPQVLGDEG